MARKDEKIISFRLDGEPLSKLEEIASRAGVSVHESAKKTLIRELEAGSHIPKIAIQSDAIKQELIELRKDFAVATEALLVSAGKATNEQALKFVNSNLRGK